MKRLLAGGCALGFVGAGLVAFASPGSAGDAPEPGEFVEIELEAKVTPAEPQVGDSFSISSVEACSDAEEVFWWLGSLTTGEAILDFAPVAEDGSWELPFEADIAEELIFYAECVPEDWEARDEYCYGNEPQVPAEEAKTLSAATEEETEEPEPTTSSTTEAPTTTETTIVEPPFDCTYEVYWLEFKVGDPPPPAPGTPKPIPGKPPYTG